MSPPARVRDALAPAWLVETVRPRRAPVPYGLMVRAALAVGVPLAVGFAAHKIALGLLPAIGALLATVVDIGGPYPARARRVTSAMLAGGAPGVVLGSLIHGMGWVTVVVLVAVAGVSSLLAAAGSTASVTGLQLLVYTAFGTGPLGALRPWWHAPVLLLAGTAWALLLIVPGWLLFPRAAEQRSVATVYEALAGELRAAGTAGFAERRLAVTRALNAAYDQLAAVRVRVQRAGPAVGAAGRPAHPEPPDRRGRGGRHGRGRPGATRVHRRGGSIGRGGAHAGPAAGDPAVVAGHPGSSGAERGPGRCGAAAHRGKDRRRRARPAGAARAPRADGRTVPRRPADLAVHGPVDGVHRRGRADERDPAAAALVLGGSHRGHRAQARSRLGVRPGRPAGPGHGRGGGSRCRNPGPRSPWVAAADPGDRARRAAALWPQPQLRPDGDVSHPAGRPATRLAGPYRLGAGRSPADRHAAWLWDRARDRVRALAVELVRPPAVAVRRHRGRRLRLFGAGTGRAVARPAAAPPPRLPCPV